MKTKHPMKIGGTLFPVGTEVKPATLEEIQKAWPKIDWQMGSKQVAVWFPDLSHPTIVSTSQIL